jgi:shikimate dehydrogenase
MYPKVDECPIDGSYTFRPGQIVYDAIYNPSKTVFLEKAEQNGCLAVNGLGWLFYQGILAYEIWTGIKLDNELLKKIFFQFKGLFGSTKKDFC